MAGYPYSFSYIVTGSLFYFTVNNNITVVIINVYLHLRMHILLVPDLEEHKKNKIMAVPVKQYILVLLHLLCLRIYSSGSKKYMKRYSTNNILFIGPYVVRRVRPSYIGMSVPVPEKKRTSNKKKHLFMVQPQCGARPACDPASVLDRNVSSGSRK